jgi:hypothetical protein
MTIGANSILSFCQAHGISRATFYNVKPAGVIFLRCTAEGHPQRKSAAGLVPPRRLISTSNKHSTEETILGKACSGKLILLARSNKGTAFSATTRPW